MKDVTGYIKTGTSDVEEFDFEIEDDATVEDIEIAAEAALWESGILDFWWKEKEDAHDE